MHESLVEEAKKISTRSFSNHYTEEEVELATAWALGEITLTQVHKVIYNDNLLGTKAYVWLALRLKEAVRKGKLKVS